MDGRTDIFALGVVLYELLTGTRAFAGPDVPTILRRLASEEPPPPTRVVPALPKGMDAVVARALAKIHDERYQTGKQLAEDLDDVLEGRAPRHAGGNVSDPKTFVADRGAAPSGRAPAQPPKPHVGEGTVQAGSAGALLGLPPGKRVSIAALVGEQRGAMFSLQKPRAVIGRAGGGAGTDIELADREVSRAHAVLECYGSRVVLRDLASTNGTFVAEERIEQTELEDRTEFRVGHTRLMLILSDED